MQDTATRYQMTVIPSLPRCDEAKELLRRMASGEARGALAYVVPLHDLESTYEAPTLTKKEFEITVDLALRQDSEALDQILRILWKPVLRRRWGHDHAVPMLYPRDELAGGQDIIADAFGAVFHEYPRGTIPRLQRVEDVPSLPLELTLADGRFGKALQMLDLLAKSAQGKVLLQRYPVGGPTSVAGLIVKNIALLEGMYTHPKLVHRLLNVCTELFIAFLKAQRERVPDVVLSNLHEDCYWPQGLGVLCEDDLILTLSPAMLLEFIIPHYRRISEEFNGILFHSCGNYAHLFAVLRDNVPNVRGIWMNAGECSFERAVEVFRGTDTVIIPRWVLNKLRSFTTRLDFVRYILATKTPDISVLLQTNFFRDNERTPEAQNAVSEEILRILEAYVAQNGLPT